MGLGKLKATEDAERCTERSVPTSMDYLTQGMLLESNIFIPKQILARE